MVTSSLMRFLRFFLWPRRHFFFPQHGGQFLVVLPLQLLDAYERRNNYGRWSAARPETLNRRGIPEDTHIVREFYPSPWGTFEA